MRAAAARGDYLAFLDADDVWVEDALDRLTAVLRADPALDMVCGLVRQFHSPELSEDVKATLLGDGAVLPGYVSALLVKRTSFWRVGSLTTQLRLGEFIEWYARARDIGLAGAVLPRVTVMRRLHAGNLGRRSRHARPDYVKVLKSVLDRRRAQA